MDLKWTAHGTTESRLWVVIGGERWHLATVRRWNLDKRTWYTVHVAGVQRDRIDAELGREADAEADARRIAQVRLLASIQRLQAALGASRA